MDVFPGRATAPPCPARVEVDARVTVAIVRKGATGTWRRWSITREATRQGIPGAPEGTRGRLGGAAREGGKASKDALEPTSPAGRGARFSPFQKEAGTRTLSSVEAIAGVAPRPYADKAAEVSSTKIGEIGIKV